MVHIISRGLQLRRLCSEAFRDRFFKFPGPGVGRYPFRVHLLSTNDLYVPLPLPGSALLLSHHYCILGTPKHVMRVLVSEIKMQSHWNQISVLQLIWTFDKTLLPPASTHTLSLITAYVTLVFLFFDPFLPLRREKEQKDTIQRNGKLRYRCLKQKLVG
ncbi:hypothetical protein GQ44DRAFT_22562 [Phaeosphaeriaceae sp. PMI808]|nr:hypothetical protein GQ44DRAFT_22562 [Phaeosphaeriaceae sp. PMI808]